MMQVQTMNPADMQPRQHTAPILQSNQQHNLPIKALPTRRASSHQLAITVQPSFSTYTQPTADLPPTPHSATFPLGGSSYMPTQQHFQVQQQQQQQQQHHSTSAHAHPHGLQAPVPMMRAGTQPLPITRRMSGAGPSNASGQTTRATPIPAHLVRAQAIVQMQEAKEQAQRAELRRQAATRRVNMAEASVMQAPTPSPTMASIPTGMNSHAPGAALSRPQPTIVGWGTTAPQQQQTSASVMQHPISVLQPQQPQQMQHQQLQHQQMQMHPHSQPMHSVQMVQSTSLQGMHSGMSGSMMTTQPLVVHPPPAYAYAVSSAPVHRVHPPPHPGHPGPSMQIHPMPSASASTMHMGAIGMGRPMARMPSPRSLAVGRKATGSAQSSPSKRSPAGAKRRTATAPMQPGGFSWGEATFINFTSDDAQKLLTGVAPSGSQSKRKREEDAARAAAAAAAAGGTNIVAGGSGDVFASALDMDREGSKRSRNGE